MRASALVILFCLVASAAVGATWYVDLHATGANDGTSWANAWTTIQQSGHDAGFVQPGDTVEISAGLYTNNTSFYLTWGTTNNWVTYMVAQTNGHQGVVTSKAEMVIRNFTKVYTPLSNGYESTISNNTYLVHNITNNIGLVVDKTGDPTTNQVAFLVQSTPIIVQWVECIGIATAVTPSSPTIVFEYTGDAEIGNGIVTMEVGYDWFNTSFVDGPIGVGGCQNQTNYGSINIHHCLFENEWEDNCKNFGNGLDYHHNVVQGRGDPINRHGCADEFQSDVVVGSMHHIRIYNNILVPRDNSITAWGAADTYTNIYWYNNVFTRCDPFHLPANQDDYQGNGIYDADWPSSYTNNRPVSGNYWLNNTIDMSLHGPDSLMQINSKDIQYNTTSGIPFLIQSNGFVFNNNLFLHFSNQGNWIAAPLGLYAVDPGSGLFTWQYDSNAMVLDYNVWYSEFPSSCSSWHVGTSTNFVMLTNATDIARVTGHTNNVSGVAFSMYDEPSEDYRPTNTFLVRGKDLTSLTNIMPYLDTDIYGNRRPFGSNWTVGAVEYQAIPPSTNPPVIVRDLVNLTNELGQYPTFADLDTGTPTRWHTWYFNGSPILTNQLSYLTVANMQSNNVGNYFVVITNSFGSVTSRTATLSIAPCVPPIIEGNPNGGQPLNYLGQVGSVAYFTVENDGSLPLSYQWYTNGVLCQDGGIIHGSQSAQLQFLNLTLAYNNYTNKCMLSNACGVVFSSNAVLTVTAGSNDPQINNQPQNTATSVGQSATFSLTASGTSPFFYYWTVAGSPVPFTDAVYTRNNCQLSDNGAQVGCLVSNSVGTVQSVYVTLTVTNYYNSLTNGLVIWYTFAQDDGWTTNHAITDRSGWGNHAYYMASTNHNTWPAYTNGPNAGFPDAAQFVVNYTNSGSFQCGTYAAITSISTNMAASGIAWFTNGTWACWMIDDVPNNALGSADDGLFLSTAQEPNSWKFGKYYGENPEFWRSTFDITNGYNENGQFYASFPPTEQQNVGWHHYAVTWDGTNWVDYLDGVLFTRSSQYTNNNNSPPAFGYITNKFTGTLVSTNSSGGIFNWIGLGVNTHSGTPNPDDADGFPNNGQFWGRLADVRVYNRPLTAAEVASIGTPPAAVSAASWTGGTFTGGTGTR